MMILNKKGFTLIELLTTIVIVGLVVGISFGGIINILDDSEDKQIIISEASIKEAARIYSIESDSNLWKENSKYIDYDFFCVTIGELMNKGLIDKNASLGENVSKDTFVIVKRNKITLVVEKEEITIKNDYNHNFCAS